MVVYSKNYIVLILIFVSLILTGCGSKDADAAAASEATVTPAPAIAATATPTVVKEEVPAHDHTAQPDSHPAADKTQSDSDTADSAAEDVVTLDIEMHDSYYGDSDTNASEPPLWHVKTGQTVLVNLVNHGTQRHNWAIVKLGSKIPAAFDSETDASLLLAEPGMVYASSQTQWALRAPEPGEYVVICTVNGHYPTMQGRLIVSTE